MKPRSDIGVRSEHTIARPKSPIVGLGPTDSEILAAEIDDAAAQVQACYKHLPRSAKVSALKLGHSLSNLRQRLVAMPVRG